MIGKIEKLKLVLAKNDAYLLYFLLEASEGLCFYSTLPSDSTKPGLAIIELQFDPSTGKEVKHLLNSIRQQSLISFEIIEN